MTLISLRVIDTKHRGVELRHCFPVTLHSISHVNYIIDHCIYSCDLLSMHISLFFGVLMGTYLIDQLWADICFLVDQLCLLISDFDWILLSFYVYSFTKGDTQEDPLYLFMPLNASNFLCLILLLYL